jgi:colanic acid biosynthesis protein WcaH
MRANSKSARAETDRQELSRLIDAVESAVENPSEGLPEDVFLFVTRVTPMINVDLLIRSEAQGTLLTWRDDGFYTPGWHVPGGIVRYKETIAERIAAVAARELGAQVQFTEPPLAMNEVIQPPSRRIRGHFISLLYQCTLTKAPASSLEYREGVPKPGEWAWHEHCPDNLLAVHEMYRRFWSP